MATILIVDDTPEIALIAQRLCKPLGHELICYEKAMEAWKYLQQRQPDLVLLDINLPGVSGVDLCLLLRTTPSFAQLRLALFSQWDRPEDILAGLKAGATYVVAKDLLCRPRDWRERVDEILAMENHHAAPLSLNCGNRESPSRPAREGVVAIDQVLRHPILLLFGPDMLHWLLHQSLTRVQLSDETVLERGILETWLAPDGVSLHVEYVLQTGQVRTLVCFVQVFMEQVVRLLGATATASFRSTMAAAVSRLFPKAPWNS